CSAPIRSRRSPNAWGIPHRRRSRPHSPARSAALRPPSSDLSQLGPLPAPSELIQVGAQIHHHAPGGSIAAPRADPSPHLGRIRRRTPTLLPRLPLVQARARIYRRTPALRLRSPLNQGGAQIRNRGRFHI